MYKVKQWRNIGIEFVDGDVVDNDYIVDIGVTIVNKGVNIGHLPVSQFTPRKNTGTQPVPDGVMIDFLTKIDAYRGRDEFETRLSHEIDWREHCCSHQVKKWKPSLTQPLIDNKNKESEMSESEIHKAWAALKGDLANAIDDIFNIKTHLIKRISKGGRFKVGDYAFSAHGEPNKENWEVICTIQEFTDHCEMMKEKRMDIIGQNGNDGLHYDNTAQQFESLASDSKPVFTQAMADKGELPPVGSYFIDIEYNDHEPVLAIAHHLGKVVYATCDDSEYRVEYLCALPEECKPIQSPREKAIKEMVSVFAGNDDEMPIDEMCEEIYKAGYRKLTPDHAKMYDDKTQFFGEDYK